MGNSYKTVLPLSDKQILNLFSEIEKKSQNRTQYKYSSFQETMNSDNEFIVETAKSQNYNINNAMLQFDQFFVEYKAFHAASGHEGVQAHNIYSVVRFHNSDNQQFDRDAYHSIVGICASFLKKNSLLPITRTDEPAPSDQQQVILSAIQSAASDQIVRTNEFFQEMTRQFEERKKALEEQAVTDREAVDQLRSKAIDEADARRSELDEERRKLENLKLELDDRDNTHARRATRQDLLEILKSRQQSFSVSNDTKRLRWPIHAIFALLLFGTGTGAIWSMYVWGTIPQASWTDVTSITSGIKSIVLSFAFLTSAGLYISWMNRWFDKHAEAQFVTKQYEIDINRATWAVEAALEWQKRQGGDMPPALLNGITQHLFERDRGESAEYSPMDALASSILGAASNMKLNMGGAEINLDRKSVREISRHRPEN